MVLSLLHYLHERQCDLMMHEGISLKRILANAGQWKASHAECYMSQQG